ncbi:MAG: glycosyltransferase [Pseudomonadota bacterium]
MRLIGVTPSTAPVGGIAKLLDYTVHAARLGYEAIFAPLDVRDGESVLFEKPYFLRHGHTVEVTRFFEIEPRPGDVVLFTLPSNHKHILAHYAQVDARLIHLIQNVRHANIHFDSGYAFRLLAKPMTRIAITAPVRDAVAPFVEDRERLHLINHGFDFQSFDRRPLPDDPMAIAYNTFKSDLGEEIVAAATDAGLDVPVHVVKRGASWEELARSYHSATVFLGTPLMEEGLYLPALEAMAAGCVPILSDAGGTRFYTDFDENALEVGFENISGYVHALLQLRDNWDSLAQRLRCNAYETAKGMDLDLECDGFEALMSETAQRQPMMERV